MRRAAQQPVLRLLFMLGLALTITVASADRAVARDAQVDPEAGFYAALAGHAAVEQFQIRDYSASTGGGFSLRMGYQWNRWLAFDIGYEFTVNSVAPAFTAPPADETNVYTHFFPINAKLYFVDLFLPTEDDPPENDDRGFLTRIHPTLLVGIGPMWSSPGEKQFPANRNRLDDTRGMAYQAGLGLEVDATDHLTTFVEGKWVAGMGSIDETRYIGVGAGVMYRF